MCFISPRVNSCTTIGAHIRLERSLKKSNVNPPLNMCSLEIKMWSFIYLYKCCAQLTDLFTSETSRKRCPEIFKNLTHLRAQQIHMNKKQRHSRCLGLLSCLTLALNEINKSKFVLRTHFPQPSPLSKVQTCPSSSPSFGSGKATGVFMSTRRNDCKALNVSQPSASRRNQRCHSSFKTQPDENT